MHNITRLRLTYPLWTTSTRTLTTTWQIWAQSPRSSEDDEPNIFGWKKSYGKVATVAAVTTEADDQDTEDEENQDAEDDEADNGGGRRVWCEEWARIG